MAWLTRLGAWISEKSEARLEQDRLEQIAASPEKDQWWLKRLVATDDDPNWLIYFHEVCESPAETAFLDALVTQLGLRPRRGILLNSQMRCELQVRIDSYRVDFLVDGWLVVEIDGAEYHSSPEAIARDQARDEFLCAQRYRVLRIPARKVFKTPKEAVQSVLDRRDSGKPAPHVARANGGPTTIGGVLNAVSAGVERAHAHIQRIDVVRRVTADLQAAIYEEGSALEAAVRSAELRRTIDEYLGNDLDRHRDWVAIEEEVDGLFEDDQLPRFAVRKAVVLPNLGEWAFDEAAARDVSAKIKQLMDVRSANWSRFASALRDQPEFARFAYDELLQMGIATETVAELMAHSESH